MEAAMNRQYGCEKSQIERGKKSPVWLTFRCRAEKSQIERGENFRSRSKEKTAGAPPLDSDLPMFSLSTSAGLQTTNSRFIAQIMDFGSEMIQDWMPELQIPGEELLLSRVVELWNGSSGWQWEKIPNLPPDIVSLMQLQVQLQRIHTIK
ncbi:hypothetical protein DM860_000057 [Cuscuta australis]|uniref:Uncharacterized protein n=1 Tax=Cuscuta australis TaxID=267555 RepID=A0A328D0F9_9ASTE|nr:hypothetical protein DM860_000057 [Cuscuta australis]